MGGKGKSTLRRIRKRKASLKGGEKPSRSLKAGGDSVVMTIIWPYLSSTRKKTRGPVLLESERIHAKEKVD